MTKYIIITTINQYDSTSIAEFMKHDYDIIVVGDKKTPHDTYIDKKMIYVHPTENNQFPDFESAIPYNHYCRKNIGYLHAIKNGATEIFDTDDDNYPLENFSTWDKTNEYKLVYGSKFPNILSLFTNQHLWNRGYPIEKLQSEQTILLEEVNESSKNQIGIIQSLAENDPDVDAICRLTNKDYNNEIIFKKNLGFIIKRNTYVQGNTQATLWRKPELFHLLYIPCTVSFRFCDILKMYVAQKCMWQYNLLFSYISPIVLQERNEHDFMNDFKSEYPMYINILNIVDNIFECITLKQNKTDLLTVYTELYKYNIVNEKELNIIQMWLKYV